MQIQIDRNGERYVPYSIEAVNSYLTSGTRRQLVCPEYKLKAHIVLGERLDEDTCKYPEDGAGGPLARRNSRARC